MTFDPTSSLARQQDPESIRNFRIPALDLDSLYGERAVGFAPPGPPQPERPSPQRAPGGGQPQLRDGVTQW